MQCRTFLVAPLPWMDWVRVLPEAGPFGLCRILGIAITGLDFGGNIGSQNDLKIQIDVMLILKSSLLVDLITRIGLIQSCENF